MSIEQTDEKVSNLVDAMWQMLDDMGNGGQSVCLSTKAYARVALEPFLIDGEGDYLMPLEEALEIVKEE